MITNIRKIGLHFATLFYLFSTIGIFAQQAPGNTAGEEVENSSAGTNPCTLTIDIPSEVCINKPAIMTAKLTKCTEFITFEIKKPDGTLFKTVTSPTKTDTFEIQESFPVKGNYSIKVTAANTVPQSATILVYEDYTVKTEKDCTCIGEEIEAWLIDCDGNIVDADNWNRTVGFQLIKVENQKAYYKAINESDEPNDNTIFATKNNKQYSKSLTVTKLEKITPLNTAVPVGGKTIISATFNPDCDGAFAKFTTDIGSFDPNDSTVKEITGRSVTWYAPANIDSRIEVATISALNCGSDYAFEKQTTVTVVKTGLFLELENSKMCANKTIKATAYKFNVQTGRFDKPAVEWFDTPDGKVSFSKEHIKTNVNDITADGNFEHEDVVTITILDDNGDTDSKNITLYKKATISGPPAICKFQTLKYTVHVCKKGVYQLEMSNTNAHFWRGDILRTLTFEALSDNVTYNFEVAGWTTGNAIITLSGADTATKDITVVDGPTISGLHEICRNKGYTYFATVCEKGDYRIEAAPDANVTILNGTFTAPEGGGSFPFIVSSTANGNFDLQIHKEATSEDSGGQVGEDFDVNVSTGIVLRPRNTEHCITDFSNNCLKFEGETCDPALQNQNLTINISNPTVLKLKNNHPGFVIGETFNFELIAIGDGVSKVTLSAPDGTISNEITVVVTDARVKQFDVSKGQDWEDYHHIILGPFFTEEENMVTMQVKPKQPGDPDPIVESWDFRRIETVGACGETVTNSPSDINNGDQIVPDGGDNTKATLTYKINPRFRYIVEAKIKCPNSNDTFLVYFNFRTEMRENKILPFAPSSKYRTVNIHGQPQTSDRPQQNSESDQAGSSFSIDAYNLAASYSTTDVSIPLLSSELRLEFRRTASPDTKFSNLCTLFNKSDPWKNIMGLGWRSNITARVDYTEEGFTVLDENGGSYEYDLLFNPKRETFSNQEAAQHKLEKVDGGLLWTKKYGTKYYFQYSHVSDGGINDDSEDEEEDECTGSQGNDQPGTFPFKAHYRIKDITDRNGNKLVYEYQGGLLFPVKIYYDQQPELFIEFSYEKGRLKTVTDPIGRVYEYVFDDRGLLEKVIQPQVPVNTEADPTADPILVSPEVMYDYQLLQSSTGNSLKLFVCLSKVTDARLNEVSLEYEVLFSNTADSRVSLKSLTSPDGTATFSSNLVINSRTNTIVDTKNNEWKYEFSTSEFITAQGQEEFLLDQFKRTLNNDLFMTAKFSRDANSSTINISEVIDYHGNKCKYEYGVRPVTYFKNGAQVTENYDFGKFGQPYREILDPDGLAITKQFGYEPAFSQMVSIVDPRGFAENNIAAFTTAYDIDAANGNRIAEYAPEGKTTTFEYQLGYQTKAVDADGRTTLSKRFYHTGGWDDVTVVLLNYGDTRTYDELGIDYTAYTPDPEDDIILTVKKCDLVGNVIKVIDANGNVTENIFDDLNTLIITKLPAVPTYGQANEVHPIILIHRDANRQVVGKQDARGNWTTMKYDSMLRPIETTVEVSANGAVNITTSTSYDDTGNKELFTDGRGVVYKFGYDPFNNLIEEIKDFGAGKLNLTSTYIYGDNSGNDLFGDSGFVPTKKVDPRGLVTLLEYDNAYRLKRTKRGLAGSEALLSEIFYDAAGNVAKTITYNNKISNISGDYEDNIADVSGNQETLTVYDKLNRPVATAVDLDGDGASVTDADDIVTQTFYDKAGNVVKVLDPEEHSSQTQYDAAGRVVRQVVNLDDNPQVQTVNGNPFSIITAAVDIETTKFYDDNSNVLEETILNDTAGAVGNQTVSKEYDALNRVSSVTDPEGFQTFTEYDLNSNVRYVKNARGFETVTEFDEANRAFKQTLPEVFDAEAGVNTNPAVTTFFDTNSNVVKTVDTRGLVTLNVFDNLNRLEKTTQVVDANDPSKDIISLNSYDGNNNLIQTTFKRDDSDLVTSTVYDSLDRPLVTTDPEGFKSVVFCDLVGNKIKLFDKRANANADETVNAVPQLRYFTQVKFDLANRMVKNTLPEIPVASRDVLGAVNVVNTQPFSEVTYLKNNWVVQTKDLNGNITVTDYDSAGRKVKITTAIGQETLNVYDKSSNVLTQTVKNDAVSGGDQITSYQYDKRNLLLKEKLNEGDALFERVYEYTYDENGNKKTRKFPNADLTTYNFDGLDRLISEVYANAPAENRTYSYNNNGAVINATDQTGITEYSYDILGRQIKETKKDGAGNILTVVESVYDKANNRIRCYFPNDKKTLVSLYDKRNLLITMKGFHGKVLPADEAAYTTQPEITSYSYNGNAQQVSCTTPNTQTTVKTYDQADRILSSSTTANNLHIYTATYKRDAVGNQLQAVEQRYDRPDRTLNFEYDQVYRLTKETDNISGSDISTEYQFDLQGNRLNKIVKDAAGNQTELWVYSNDNLNRTTQVLYSENSIHVKTFTYNYDLNGNRLNKIIADISSGSNLTNHTSSYDQENRLKSVADNSGDIFTASYDYRTRRMIKGEGTNSAQNILKTTTYIYDGGVTCQETQAVNGTEMLVKQYIRGNGMGGGIGSVLYMERAQDLSSSSQAVQDFYSNLGYSTMTVEHYAYNAVGSVVANTDQQGFVIRENDFDAYGNQVREQDWTSDNFPTEFGGSQNDLLFSTKERDFSTGLDYFGFRYYDAVLGKFTTRDPSGYPDGPNNYLYVNNNPINAIDPLGLEEEVFIEVKEDSKIIPAVEGNVKHKAIQETLADGKKVVAEQPNKGSGPSGGTGKIDLVDNTKMKVTEIKPASQQSIKEGLEQLARRKGVAGYSKELMLYKNNGKVPGVGDVFDTVRLSESQAKALLKQAKAQGWGSDKIFEMAQKMSPKNAESFKVSQSALDKGTKGIRIGGHKLKFKMAGGALFAILDAAAIIESGRRFADDVNSMFPFVGTDVNGNQFSIGESYDQIPLIPIRYNKQTFIRYHDGPKKGKDIPIPRSQFDKINKKFWDDYKKKYPTQKERDEHQERLIQEYKFWKAYERGEAI